MRAAPDTDAPLVGADAGCEAVENWAHLHRTLPDELWPALEGAAVVDPDPGAGR